MEFAFSPKKNAVLLAKRGVSFPMVIETIAEKGILLDFKHPNQTKYPHQRVMIIELGGYAYCVPYLIEGEIWQLKTIYPSRRFKYLLEGDSNG